MRARFMFGRVRWMLIALLLGLTPHVVLARQEAAQDQNQPSEDLPESLPSQAVGAQTDEEQRPAETAQAGEELDGAARTSQAQEDAQGEAEAAGGQAEQGPQVISGMSILGNQEAPTSLVIVPWKGSELGEAVGISTMLDDSRTPVDKEVFLRALRFYEIRSETNP